MTTVAGYKGFQKLSGADQKAFVKTANYIGVNPDWLGAVFQFEGNFDPAIKNKAGSGATGLIQFMPSTARNLGTTTEALAKMTFQQQLKYVEKYFEPWRGRLHSLEDTYLAVFYPAAIGKANDAIIASEGSAVYEQNAGFDHDEKGYITKSDITGTIRSVYNSAQNNPRITVPILTFGAVVGWGAVSYAAYKMWKG